MKDSTYEQQKQVLIEEITAAFDGVSREDGVTLHEAIALDDYEDAEGCAKARTKDIETRWQDVPDEHIRSSEAVLSFLDTKGFRYYIPAFLVWYLKYMDSEDPDFWSNNFDAVDFALRGHGSWLVHFKALTFEQSRAIAHFLIFVAKRDEEYLELFDGYAKYALEDYWQQFA